MTWLITLLAFGCWLGIGVIFDRPTSPAWRTRNAYRWLCAVLVFCCWLMGTKTLVYRAELRSLIESCR